MIFVSKYYIKNEEIKKLKTIQEVEDWLTKYDENYWSNRKYVNESNKKRHREWREKTVKQLKKRREEIKLRSFKMLMSKIIFLNGCSSAGKTSLVKAIQYLSEEPWLTFGIDTFFKALSPKYLPGGKEAENGINFVPGMDQEGFPIMEVKGGPYAKKLAVSFPKMMKQLVYDGHNLIIDEVIWDKKDLENCASTLKNHLVCYVKVNCELPLTEEREVLRSDRALGLARAQFSKIKDLDWNYDLEVDTSQTNHFANAQKILEFVNNDIRLRN